MPDVDRYTVAHFMIGFVLGVWGVPRGIALRLSLAFELIEDGLKKLFPGLFPVGLPDTPANSFNDTRAWIKGWEYARKKFPGEEARMWKVIQAATLGDDCPPDWQVTKGELMAQAKRYLWASAQDTHPAFGLAHASYARIIFEALAYEGTYYPKLLRAAGKLQEKWTREIVKHFPAPKTEGNHQCH